MIRMAATDAAVAAKRRGCPARTAPRIAHRRGQRDRVDTGHMSASLTDLDRTSESPGLERIRQAGIGEGLSPALADLDRGAAIGHQSVQAMCAI
jgi:hypothetical protein